MVKTKKRTNVNTKSKKLLKSKNSKTKFKQNNGSKNNFGKGKDVRHKSCASSKLTNAKPFRENNVNAKKQSTNSGFKTAKRRFRDLPLRERMMEKLKSAKFRFMNEQLYTSNSKEIGNVFRQDKKSYNEYHEGFRQQVAQWPINPVDVIIKTLLRTVKSDDNIKIADFGCGEAKIAESLEGHAEVYSFDLVALNDRVTECDMSHTTLQDSSVDIVVFCLSLMGTSLSAYIAEANRVLKDGGTLKIAEVESRFDSIDAFINTLERYGFKLTSHDLSHAIFYFLNFKKVSNISKKRKNKLPELDLKPCLYKKR